MENSFQPIKYCNVHFNEENLLIDQIINLNKNLLIEEIRPFYKLKKNLKSVEKNILVFNNTINRFCIFIGAYSVYKEDKSEKNLGNVLSFIFQQSELQSFPSNQKVSQLEKSLNLNILNIFSYFQENTIDDACAEVIIALENVYSSAWRVKSSLKEFKNFKPKGVTLLRNHLLEHPSEDFNWVLSSFNFSIDNGPIITYVQVPKLGKNFSEDKIDIYIERDLIKFKKALFQRLTSNLNNLRP